MLLSSLPCGCPTYIICLLSQTFKRHNVIDKFMSKSFRLMALAHERRCQTLKNALPSISVTLKSETKVTKSKRQHGIPTYTMWVRPLQLWSVHPQCWVQQSFGLYSPLVGSPHLHLKFCWTPCEASPKMTESWIIVVWVALWRGKKGLDVEKKSLLYQSWYSIFPLPQPDSRGIVFSSTLRLHFKLT